MRHFQIEFSRWCNVILLSQERHLVAMSNGSSEAVTSSSSDSLMSARSRHSSFLFVLSSVALTTMGLPQITGFITAVTPARCSIPAILPQDLLENPLYVCGYSGITDIPITMQLSRPEVRSAGGPKCTVPEILHGVGFRRGLPPTDCGSLGVSPELFMKFCMQYREF